jgi:hypothetical protein
MSFSRVKLWLVKSAKEGNNKTKGLDLYSVFQSVAAWFEYLYSPEQYLLGYHIREEVSVCRKESIFFNTKTGYIDGMNSIWSWSGL